MECKRDGIININKPAGMSSHKCLQIVKRQLWEQMPADTRPKFKNWRVGHLGTLDPLASGVLVLLCGKATKMFDELSGNTKRMHTLLQTHKYTNFTDNSVT